MHISKNSCKIFKMTCLLDILLQKYKLFTLIETKITLNNVNILSYI